MFPVEKRQSRPKFLRKSSNCQGHISQLLAGNSIHMVKLFFSFCFFFFSFGQKVAPSSSASVKCKLARRVTILSLVFISSVRLHGRM